MSGKRDDDRPVSRKDFLRGIWRGAAGLIQELAGDKLDLIDRAFPDLIRPPGACHETTFLERCSRCGACQQACPFFVIKRVIRPGTFDDGTPHLVPREGFCRFCVDFPCIAACPTAALEKPAEGKLPRLGMARVDGRLCVRSRGTDCQSCVQACPERFAAIPAPQPGTPPIPQADRCTGCGACEGSCPVQPESAIRVTAP